MHPLRAAVGGLHEFYCGFVGGCVVAVFVAVLLLACRVLRSWLLLELLIFIAVAVGLSELLLVEVDKKML